MGILDKIESVAQGLMLFEGDRQVMIKMSVRESEDLARELLGEYPDLEINFGVVVDGFKSNHYHFNLHRIDYIISFPNEA